jgi:CYTH domain-containing protein
MPKEIERKFLVTSDQWRTAQGKSYRQGYLCRSEQRSVRVRTTPDGAYLTVKGLSTTITRLEYEYEIPMTEAQELLDSMCIKPIIEKTRYKVVHHGMIWEVDEFHGDNTGLVVAEIELESEDQEFPKPEWVGEEVTGDPRYLNVNLVVNPYSSW